MNPPASLPHAVRKRFRGCLAGLLAMLGMVIQARSQGVTAQPDGAVERSPTIEAIRARGRILAASTMRFRTFNHKNPQSGQAEGFMADLGKALAKSLLGDERRIEWVQAAGDAEIRRVASGDVDIAIDAVEMGPRGEKMAEADFGAEIFRGGSSFLVPGSSRFQSVDDVRDATRVVYARGDEHDLRHVMARAPRAVYIAFPDPNAAFEALRAGKGDVMTGSIVSLYDLAAQDGSYTVTGRYTEDPYCLVTRKGDPAFHRYLDDFVQSLIASGERERLYQKWFVPLGGNINR